MALASGTGVRIGYVQEVTRGLTPPTPTLKTLRLTQRDINLDKETLESKEVRQSRQKADVRHGFNHVVGTFGFELSIAAYDDWLAYTLANSWVAVTSGIGTFNAVASPAKFTRATGSWVTDGFRPGDWVTTTGFTGGNNGTFQVTTVTALDLSVAATLTNETGAGNEQVDVQGKRLDTGTSLLTTTVERQFTDITKFQVFRGTAVDKMKLAVTQKNLAGGTFSMIGMSSLAGAGTSISASPPTAAPTHSPFAAFDGSIYHNGTSVAVVTSFEVDLNNNRKLEGVIGSKFSPDVFEGEADITGSTSLFLEDMAYYDEFFNEDEVSMSMKLLDPNDIDFMVITFPRIKWLNNKIDPPQNGPIVQVVPFRALESTTFPGVTMTIQRSNVV